MHLLLPVGDETSVGHDAVALAQLAGLTLDEWQSWFLRTSMCKHDGRWSAFEVGLIVPRQNGKGSLLEARQLAGLFLLEEPLAVHSAHEFKTAYEHFLRISALIEGCPDLDRRVMRVRRGAGEQAIELKSGCRLRFLARSTGSGRGLTGDTIYLDEAFALTTPMMGALLPTLSAVPDPQVWYTSSAPRDTSDVLHGLRRRGRDGEPARLFYAEWGLDTGADIDDVGNWLRTNPAMGIRIDEEFVRAELAAMQTMPEEFARERLGIADTPEGEVSQIPNWDDLRDDASAIASHHRLALDVAPKNRFAAIGAAGRRADGRLHVEAVYHAPGTGWIVDKARASWDLLKIPFIVQAGSPAAAFVSRLREVGVEVDEVTASDHAAALGALRDAAESDGLRHIGQNTLSSAVRDAEVRVSSDGAELWGRRTSKVDITTLVAVTLAAGAVPAPLTAAAVDNVW